MTGDGTVRARAGEVVAEIETDGGGKARTPELYLGSYAVYERQAPEGYVLNGEPVVANLDYAGQHVAVTSASSVVGDAPQKGVIEVAKVDAETGRAIPAAGTAFEVVAHSNVITPDGTVRYSGGEVVAEIETDDSGMASTPELYLGSYDVVETRAPYGYVVADPVRVDLSYAGQEVSVSSEKVGVADEPAKGTISIAKVDAETGKFIRVAGIGARVQAAEDIYTPDGTLRYSEGDVVAEIETDSTGTASTPELYLGAYEVVETLAPEGYLVNTTAHSVVLSYAGQAVPVVTAGTVMEDVAAKGVIEVAKVDAETGKAIPASGTTFEIRAAEDIVTADLTLRAAAGEVVATVETNASGIATSPELYLGSYDVVETHAPDGYVLDSTPRGVVLSYAGQEVPVVHASVVAGNRPAMGVVELTKSDLETGLPVKASAEYEVVAAEDIVTSDGTLRVAKGETADRIVIGEDGKGFSKPLYLGAYDVVETKAPEGYMIDADPHRVSLLYEGQDVPVSYLSMECRDAPQKGAIEITKTDAETGEPVEGSVYEVVAAENIVTGDGTVREQQGDVVAVLETGPDGTAAAEGLYLGSYDVVESSQTDGYVLDPERHRVVLEYAGQEVAVSEARLDVVNVPNRLVVDKTDSEGNELSGVGFAWWPAASEVGLPRSDGAGAVGVAVPENEDGDVVAIQVIGENGDEKDLACEDGVWTAPAPFGACSIRAELSEGGVLLAEVELSEDSPEAAFEVREGELVRVPALTRCGVSEGMTSEDGSLRIERLGPGAWVIAEVAPLPGYVPDPAPRVVEVAPDGTVSGSAEAVLGFVNDKTQVLFSKIDSETGRELSGAVLQIVDGQGHVVEEWTSGSDPHAVKGLPVGEYVFRETQAPDGYLVAEDVMFEVRGIAEAQEVSMIDERVPEFEEAAPAEPFDKTGDWLLAHWRSAAGMLLMGGSSVAAGLRLAGRRRTAGR